MNQQEKHMNNFVDSPIVKWMSIIIALIGFIGFCCDHFIENEPDLTFTIVNEASLLNDKANIPSLHIVLDSIDLRTANSNISIYTIKVVNEGKQHITKDMYDESVQLFVKRGKYIGSPVLSYASSLHINSCFSKKSLILNENVLNLPDVSMDKDNAYCLDVTIFHPIDSLPIFEVQGKISGQKYLTIRRELKSKASFWNLAFTGGFLIQIVRIVSYFLFGLAFIVIFILLNEKIKSVYYKSKFRRAIKKITSHHLIGQQIIDDFNKIEKTELMLMYQWLIPNNEAATMKYAQTQKKCNSKSEIDIYRHTRNQRIVQYMIQNKYLSISSTGDVLINKSMKKDFIFVYKQLKKQKLLKPISF